MLGTSIEAGLNNKVEAFLCLDTYEPFLLYFPFALVWRHMSIVSTCNLQWLLCQLQTQQYKYRRILSLQQAQ